jgi:hypothetical protein
MGACWPLAAPGMWVDVAGAALAVSSAAAQLAQLAATAQLAEPRPPTHLMGYSSSGRPISA